MYKTEQTIANDFFQDVEPTKQNVIYIYSINSTNQHYVFPLITTEDRGNSPVLLSVCAWCLSVGTEAGFIDRKVSSGQLYKRRGEEAHPPLLQIHL